MEDNKVADATFIIIVAVMTLFYFVYKKCLRVRRTRNNIYNDRNSVQTTDKSSVMIITGSGKSSIDIKILVKGGHTREILCLVEKIGSKYDPRYYIIADTDQISEQKVHALERQCKSRDETEIKYSIHKVPRSREVSQSWITTVVSTLYACLYSFPIVFRLQPDVILCNGPGTCIPVCFAGLLLKWLHIKQTVVIYIESICRVETLSMSAKILYYLADHILVQWSQIRDKYPKCQYIGRVV